MGLPQKQVYDDDADDQYAPSSDMIPSSRPSGNLRSLDDFRRERSQQQALDNSTGALTSGPGLTSIEGGGESTPRRRGHLRDATNEAASAKSFSSDDIQKKEDNTENTDDQASSDEKANLPTTAADQASGGWITNIRNKKKKAKNNTGKLVAAFAGVGGMAFLFTVGIFLLGAFKIPHFMENVTSWQMARTSRAFTRAVSSANNESFRLSNAPDNDFLGLKNKYSNLREGTWGKLDKYRPQKVLENLGEDGNLTYNYSEAEGRFSRPKLKSITVNGEEIKLPESRRFHPFENRSNLREFNAKLDANLDSALGDKPNWVRSKVGNNIREDIGFKKLSWWKKQGREYKGLKADEAELLTLKESYANAEGKAAEVKSDIHAVDEETKKARTAMDEAVQNADDADQLIKDRGGLTNKVSEDITTSMEAATEGLGTKALSTASIIVGVGMPLCMIYEGSIENSGPLVDEQDKAVQREYYEGAVSADQIKAGHTTAEATGALVKKFGRISNSVPLNRASGRSGKDLVSKQVSAQASGNGTYTIIDTLFGKNIITEKIIGSADTICPKLTDWRVGVGIAAVELGVQAFQIITTAGTATAAEEAAAEGAKVATTKAIEHEAEELVAKSAVEKTLLQKVKGQAKDAAKKAIVEGAAIAGLTFLAKYYVTSHMLASFNGTSMDQDFAEQVDMGGNAHANEMNRQMMYGRPMTNSELAYDMDSNRQYFAQKKQEKSVYDRYFAVSQYDSLISNVGMSIDTSSVGFGTLSRFSNPLDSFKSIAGRLSSALQPRSMVFAEDTASASAQNYNQVQWGWDANETKLIEDDSSYQPLENDYRLEQSGKKDAIENDYKHCYEDSIGTLLSEKHILRTEDGSLTNDGDCSPSQLGVNNPKYGDLVFRWRLSKMYENTLDHLSEIQNPAADSGNTNGNSSGTTGSAIDPNLPSGSKEELIEKIKASGKVTNANLLDTRLHQTTLAVLLKLTEKYSFTLWQGAHRNNEAVDLGNINGKGVPTGNDYAAVNEDASNFIRDVVTLIPNGNTWMGVSNEHFTTIGNEILKPKGGSVNLDLPSTTGASGAHFHIATPTGAP